MSPCRQGTIYFERSVIFLLSYILLIASAIAGAVLYHFYAAKVAAYFKDQFVPAVVKTKTRFISAIKNFQMQAILKFNKALKRETQDSKALPLVEEVVPEEPSIRDRVLLLNHEWKSPTNDVAKMMDKQRKESESESVYNNRIVEMEDEQRAINVIHASPVYYTWPIRSPYKVLPNGRIIPCQK